MKRSVRITIIGMVFNTLLFFMKLSGWLLSNSLALFSDAVNSLLDICASVAIFLAVRIALRKADTDHPFGHHRAEPIAGLIVAILAAILGFEIIKNAFEGFFMEKDLRINLLVLVIVFATIAVKLYLYILFRMEGKNAKSPALMASSMDHRNDILVSFSVLVSNLAAYTGYAIFDSIIALCIGGFIVYSGFRIGMENIDFLMGKVPPAEVMEKLKRNALGVDGVKNVHDVRAHYIGDIIQAEIHIEVDKSLRTEESHRIAESVKDKLERTEVVDYAFVHVDPV
jgi:cation diffusion facilitator family transporter